MRRIWTLGVALVLFHFIPLPLAAEVDLDNPAQETKLNKEIWHFAKGTSYSAMKLYVKQAQAKSQKGRTAEVTLPTGWKIAPAGAQLELGRMPCEALPFAGRLAVLNNGYYRKEDAVVSFVNLQTNSVEEVLTFHSLFPSATVGLENDLYISGGFDGRVHQVNSDLKRAKTFTLPGYIGGLAAVDDHHLAAVLLLTDEGKGNYEKGSLCLLNTQTGQVEQKLEAGQFPYAVQLVDGKLYVSLEGENEVLVYESKDGQWQKTKALEVGKSPTNLCVDGDRLYVVNTGSDDLSVIDCSSDEVTGKVDLAQHHFRFGAAPTSCAADKTHLYVTLSYLNAVAVLDKAKGRIQGYIPTGWYPTKVALDDSNLYILSAKGIHPRRPNPQLAGPTKPPGETDYVLTLLHGSLSTIPSIQVPAHLPAWTHQVKQGSPLLNPGKGFDLPIKHIFYVIRENRTYDQVLGDLPKGNGDPKLTVFGRDVTPNLHKMAESFVTLDNFYVDGEISVLGHSFTSSGYASPFLEWLGNVGYADRLGPMDPKDHQKHKNFYPYNSMPGAFSPLYLWDGMDDKGVDYRIYGEDYYLYTKPFRILLDAFGPESALVQKFYDTTLAIAGADKRPNDFVLTFQSYWPQVKTLEGAEKTLAEDSKFTSMLSQYYVGDDSLAQELAKSEPLRAKFADFLFRYPFPYMGWDLKVTDMVRAKAWKDDFDEQVKTGKVAQLHYIWLPNDHTSGMDPKSPNPFQYVSENDAAFGFIAETIAKSPVWKDSLIVSVEDDCQNGPDHVDADRTTTFALGPYVKRGVVVSDQYDQESLLKTMEMLLGLDPLNLNDGLAVPMFSIFTDQPDFTPYTAPEPSKQLMDSDLKLYRDLSKNR